MATETEDKHDTEQPGDWGWAGEFPRMSRALGWICVVILVLMTTATHYNHSGTMWLLISAGLLVVGLLWQRHAQKRSWTKKK